MMRGFFYTKYLSDLIEFVKSNGYLNQIIIFDDSRGEYIFIEDSAFGILMNSVQISTEDFITLVVNKKKSNQNIIFSNLDDRVFEILNKKYGIPFENIKEYGRYDNNKKYIRDLKSGIYKSRKINDVYCFLYDVETPIKSGEDIKIVPVVEGGLTRFYASTRCKQRFYVLGILNFILSDIDISHIKTHTFKVNTTSYGLNKEGDKYQVIIFTIPDELSDLMSQLR